MADTIQIPNLNERAKIKIFSLAHNSEVSFFPYDFEFDDSYKPEWGTYDGFGRMDPIMTYKRTTRDVNLSFNVVAENPDMAKTNFNNLQSLIHFMYPKYIDTIGIEKSRLNALDKATQEAIEEARKAGTFALSQGLPANAGGARSPNTGLVSSVDTLRKESQKIQNEITGLQTISGFGAQVMEKSPLFQITFMNLLNKQDFVAAITNFKHKLKFDTADSSYSNDGKATPGEFSINLSFKVLHTYTPGSDLLKLNYGK